MLCMAAQSHGKPRRLQRRPPEHAVGAASQVGVLNQGHVLSAGEGNGDVVAKRGQGLHGRRHSRVVTSRLRQHSAGAWLEPSWRQTQYSCRAVALQAVLMDGHAASQGTAAGAHVTPTTKAGSTHLIQQHSSSVSRGP